MCLRTEQHLRKQWSDGVAVPATMLGMMGSSSDGSRDGAQSGGYPELDSQVDPDRDDALISIAATDLAIRKQATSLPTPVVNPTTLPLSQLEPEAFESLIAEMVSRQPNLGVQFYGRRGQEQYGLDVVKREMNYDRSLFQVKRFAVITPKSLRAAVVAYAGAPRKDGNDLPPRRFDPGRFVVVTSALLDFDAPNVDELAALQDEYRGDLVIEAWGAETLSRMLRDSGPLVYAAFNEAWAKEFCAFVPGPPEGGDPRPLGLVEGPLAALRLEAFEEEARALEATDPALASRRYESIAAALEAGHFPAHARSMRLRQANAAEVSGDIVGAFTTRFELSLERVIAGESMTPSQLFELPSADGLPEELHARAVVLTRLTAWQEHGSLLQVTVPALRLLADGRDPYAALLTCLTIEQALVDGLYDFSTPRSVFVDVDEDTPDLLSDLRALAEPADSRDAEIRARVRSAVADSRLTLDADVAAVDAAYGGLILEAGAGRYREVGALVLSRAAYAYAIRGALDKAESLWRQSILASSEASLYGDVRGASRSIELLRGERGVVARTDLDVAVRNLPNRRRLLAGSDDSLLGALESAHHERLPDALGDARRYLWESRLAGHWREEVVAQSLLGDILVEGKRPLDAADLFLASGQGERAVKVASELPDLIDVRPWIGSQVRRRQAVAVKVIAAQVALVADDAVPRTVGELLAVTEGMWGSSSWGANPGLEAVKAIAAFAIRIPEAVVDSILALSAPALLGTNAASDAVANLLIQTYWAVDSRRNDLAQALLQMLRLVPPPYNLWGLVGGIPESARLPLEVPLREMAENGEREAIMVLARWRDGSRVVQLAARRACAAQLRRPVGVPREVVTFGTQESTTVQLLLALLDADQPAEFAPDEFSPDQAHASGGVFFQAGPVTGPDQPQPASGFYKLVEAEPAPVVPSGDPPTSVIGQPDDVANVASGDRLQLAIAVARHLTAMAEDRLDGGDARAQAVRALRFILHRLPRPEAFELFARLSKVAEDPGHSEADHLLMSGSPFSRSQFNAGGAELSGLALLAAAEAFGADRSLDVPLSDSEAAFVSNATAVSISRLRDEDSAIRRIGAMTVDALIRAHRESSNLAYVLILHADAQIRALGAHLVPASSGLLEMLATDESAEVRAAVAGRPDLSAAFREQLEADPHLSVRRVIGVRGNEPSS
jgi:hypothetical protein